MMAQPAMAPSPRRPLIGGGMLRITGCSARAHESGGEGEVRVCTVNVGTLVRRSREVVEMLARRRVDICCLQEVRYRGKGATVYGDANEKYKSCGGMEAVMVWPEWA